MNPRILMVVSLFYPHCGGTQQQALTLARGLLKNGISVSVLTRHTKGLSAYEEIEGIPVYRRIRTISPGKLFGLTYMMTLFFSLLKMLTTYDIIHCHLVQGLHSPIAVIFKKLFKKKVIIKVGATGPLSDFKILKAMLGGDMMLRQIRHADRVITVCDQSTREARHAGIRLSCIEQIPNGVDIRHFTPSPANRTSNMITYVGRLDCMKGVHILLEACALLKQKDFNYRLHIVGGGPESEKLKSMAQTLGINDSVIFQGEKHDVAPLLQTSSVFVLPSLSEGLSNVVLEAMASGLPVVATRVGGTIDLIRDGENGILVDPERPDQLGDALAKLLGDDVLAKRIGRAARTTAENDFTIDAVVNKYIALYKELLTPG